MYSFTYNSMSVQIRQLLTSLDMMKVADVRVSEQLRRQFVCNTTGKQRKKKSTIARLC